MKSNFEKMSSLCQELHSLMDSPNTESMEWNLSVAEKIESIYSLQ